MFFSSVLFTKRGNLSKVWLAAHHQDKRLTKTIVVSTNIEECSHEVSDPTVPLSLRISGQLLLGVVRIYQRKVRYLQEDTQEALTKVRLSSRPGPGALELHPSHATATSSHITFMDATDNDFLDFTIPDIPLNRLETLCDDDFGQKELVRVNDMDLEPDDQFSYNLGMDHAAKHFEDTHDVLMAGEEEDIIHMEPFDDVPDRIDQSIEIGRDAPDFDVDDDLPPINIDLVDVTDKHLDIESLPPADDADIAEEPIPLLEVSHDMAEEPIPLLEASHAEMDSSLLGSVEVATPDLEGEINIAVKKPRKRKRPMHDRSTQLTTAEIMDHDTTNLIVANKERLHEPDPIQAATAGELPSFLLASSDAIGPLADPLTAFIANQFRKGRTETAMEQQAVVPDEQGADLHLDNDLIPPEPHSQLDEDVYDDALPVPEQDEQLGIDDDGHRQFEDNFISAAPESEEPLPDFIEEDWREDDDTPASNVFSTWSDRTKKMCVLLSERLNHKDSEAHLQSLIEGKPRSTAAIIFLETLILKSFDFIDIDQQQPYGNIAIKRASRFHDGAAMADMLAISG